MLVYLYVCQYYVFICLIQKFSFIFFDPIPTRALAACSLYQLAIVWLQRKPIEQTDPEEYTIPQNQHLCSVSTV